ncbi:MAG: MauE/DoxX family redox-associated membrane protein [Euzebya sp.]
MDIAPILTAVTWLGAGLLVYGGATKIPVPDGAMAALHSLGLPSGRVAARLLGVAEIGLGVVIVIVGGVAAAILSAITFGLLSLVAARQRAAQIDCGCFGVHRYPVSGTHIAVNAAIAVAGAVGVTAPPWNVGAVGADAGGLAVVTAALLTATGVGVLTNIIQRAGLAQAARL